MGFIFAVISGASMSIQGVMNARLQEKVGIFESCVFIFGISFLLSVVCSLLFGNGNFTEVFSTNKLYLQGGLIGIIITITVMLSISRLSPTLAVSTILISQLLVASIIDAFGLLGSEKVEFSVIKILGIVLMIAGVIIFKSK